MSAAGQSGRTWRRCRSLPKSPQTLQCGSQEDRAGAPAWVRRCSDHRHHEIAAARANLDVSATTDSKKISEKFEKWPGGLDHQPGSM